MNKVKSLEDLKRIREEALSKRDAKVVSGQKQVIVGMGTVGIAAGARETLKAILDFIEKENLSDIVVRQTGNIGWDSFEPIVQVVVGMIPFLGGILQLLISPFVSVFVARYITLVYDHAAETADSSPGSIQ